MPHASPVSLELPVLLLVKVKLGAEFVENSETPQVLPDKATVAICVD